MAISVALEDIKLHRELHGRDPEVGFEFDGGTVVGGENCGRYTARLTEKGWQVIYIRFPSGKYPVEILAEFGPGEKYERRAKALTIEIYRQRLEEANGKK